MRRPHAGNSGRERSALGRHGDLERSDHRTHALFISVLALVLSATSLLSIGTSNRAIATANVSAAVGDAFPRPALTDPITLNLQVGADLLRLNDNRDYILVLPGVKKTGVLEIWGGRNIWIIGGYLSVKSPGANIIIADGRSPVAGRVVHLEGLLIDGSSGAQSDGIRIKAPQAIIQLVNSRIVGLLGTKKGLHADVIQPFGGMKALRIDGLTASSHYNNLYFRRENDPLGPAIGAVTIQNANVFGYWNGSSVDPPETLRGISIGTQTVDPSNTTSSVNCQLTAPVVLRNFYIQPARKRPGQFVYPHDGMTKAGCPAKLSADGRTIGWPGMSRVDGVATIGAPPGGDFVPAANVGLRYLG